MQVVNILAMNIRFKISREKKLLSVSNTKRCNVQSIPFRMTLF